MSKDQAASGNLSSTGNLKGSDKGGTGKTMNRAEKKKLEEKLK